jgi:hypothetical protein
MSEKRINTGVLLIILGLTVLGTWSVASPVGSAADDNFHLASIWCGTFSEHCNKSNEDYQVPSETLLGMCNIIWIDKNIEKYNQNAKCTSNAPNKYQKTSYFNQKNGIYPSLFYDISSIFVGNSVQSSVIKIRIFWSVIFLILVIVIFCNLDKRSQFTMILILILKNLKIF